MPEYLDNLDRIEKGVNCLQYMPLVCLVTYVMGLEAAKSCPATKAEQQEMKRLLREGYGRWPGRVLVPAMRPELSPI